MNRNLWFCTYLLCVCVRACARILCESVGVRECLDREDIRKGKEVKVEEKRNSGAIEDAESETVKGTKREAREINGS